MSDSPALPQIETDPAKIQQLKEQIIIGARLLKMRRESEKCANSLRDFVRAGWPIIGRGATYLPNWHIDCICDHVQAMAERDIRRLVINMPPRFLKSTLVSVSATAWRWIKCPEEKFLTASYGKKLSFRDSKFTRDVIKSEWYQTRWGHIYRLTKDQNEKGYFENDKGGYRIATAPDAGTTGSGGSWRIYDDPNDMRTINSNIEREKENDYHTVMATRAIDPKTDVEICVQQRGHPKDMTGLLQDLGWEILTLPNEYEGSKFVTSIGWSDPRTHIGELLHPQRFGPLETEDMKKTIGPKYSGEFQQHPTALAGNQLKREWWKFWHPRLDGMSADQRALAVKPIQIKIGTDTVERIPQQVPDAFEQVVQSWDMAFKDLDQNDYVAGHAWGRIGANVYMLDRDHGHYDFPKTCAAVRRMSMRVPCPEKLVEDKANGPAVIQTLRNEIPGLIAVQDAGGKIARVNAVAGYVEAGNVWLPNPNLCPWVWELLNEFSDFPAVEHDDDTDAMSQALKRLFDSMANTGLPEFRVAPRIGEPANACHVQEEGDMMRSIPPNWRRWIAVAPGHPGAVLWVAESPTGSLRIYRELECLGADALEIGRRIAAATIPDVQTWMGSIHAARQWHVDLFMEKLAFAPIEPVGSYAGLLEQGLLEYEPESGEWDDRQFALEALRSAKFSAQIAMVEESSVDRLRSLMQFMPPDFEELNYDRDKAFRLSRENMPAYQKYMDAVAGVVSGEWPKLKISSQCKNLISSIGCSRRNEQVDSPDPFMRAILIGISAPPSIMTRREPQVVPAVKPRMTSGSNRRFRV